MLKKFTIQQLIFLTIIGALMFLADLLIAAPVTAATGISGTGGMASTLFWTVFLAFGAFAIKRFGSITLMHLIYGFLTIFAPITYLPGIFKIIVFLLMGIFTDVLVSLFKFRNFGYYIGIILGHAFFFIEAYFAYVLLGIPTTTQVEGAKFFIVLIPLFTLVVCGLGVFLGYKLFKKLENKKLLRQIKC